MQEAKKRNGKKFWGEGKEEGGILGGQFWMEGFLLCSSCCLVRLNFFRYASVLLSCCVMS